MFSSAQSEPITVYLHRERSFQSFHRKDNKEEILKTRNKKEKESVLVRVNKYENPNLKAHTYYLVLKKPGIVLCISTWRCATGTTLRSNTRLETEGYERGINVVESDAVFA